MSLPIPQRILMFYFTIPLEDHIMLELHTAIIGILVITLLINHVKSHKKPTDEDSK